MKEPFNSPDFPVLFFFPRGNFCLCAVQHRFHARHRVVPPKPERRQQLIKECAYGAASNKRSPRLEKSAHHRLMEFAIQFVCRLVISVCVACIL